MLLGSAFPKDLVLTSATRQLRPGVVIKVEATLDSGIKKPKRFVVLHVTDDVFVCVMNTQIHSIIANNQALMRCQVPLTPKYDFVDHDCTLDCSRVWIFSRAELLSQLTDKQGIFLGRIDDALRSSIVDALQRNDALAEDDCNEYCKALNSEDLS